MPIETQQSAVSPGHGAGCGPVAQGHTTVKPMELTNVCRRKRSTGRDLEGWGWSLGLSLRRWHLGRDLEEMRVSSLGTWGRAAPSPRGRCVLEWEEAQRPVGVKPGLGERLWGPLLWHLGFSSRAGGSFGSLQQGPHGPCGCWISASPISLPHRLPSSHFKSRFTFGVS